MLCGPDLTGGPFRGLGGAFFFFFFFNFFLFFCFYYDWFCSHAALLCVWYLEERGEEEGEVLDEGLRERRGWGTRDGRCLFGRFLFDPWSETRCEAQRNVKMGDTKRAYEAILGCTALAPSCLSTH